MWVETLFPTLAADGRSLLSIDQPELGAYGGVAVAQYKYEKYLNKSENEAYDLLFSPGENCANSGIYRCEACGDEIASNKNNPFPPQNHHQHAPGAGAIRWRLIVFAQQKK